MVEACQWKEATIRKPRPRAISGSPPQRENYPTIPAPLTAAQRPPCPLTSAPCERRSGRCDRISFAQIFHPRNFNRCGRPVGPNPSGNREQIYSSASELDRIDPTRMGGNWHSKVRAISKPFDHHCNTLPAPDAHGREAIATSAAFQFVQQLDREDRPGRPDRMA